MLLLTIIEIGAEGAGPRRRDIMEKQSYCHGGSSASEALRYLFYLSSSHLTCPVSIVQSTHRQSRPMHHSLPILALRFHCYSIISFFPARDAPSPSTDVPLKYRGNYILQKWTPHTLFTLFWYPTLHMWIFKFSSFCLWEVQRVPKKVGKSQEFLYSAPLRALEG